MKLNEMLSDSLFFGFALSLLSYWVGMVIQNKWKHPLCNPLLISTILCIGFLCLTDVTYETFNVGGKYLNYFITPATVCLAVPLYRQLQVLKENLAAVLLGVLSGALSCVFVIIGLAYLTNLEEVLTLSLLSKSVTTAIAIGITDEIGGMSSITVSAVIMSGILGNVMAQSLFKLFRIHNPVAQGLACGTASHGGGTAKAQELGDVQGAMSGLAMVIAGLATVVIVPIAAMLV